MALSQKRAAAGLATTSTVIALVARKRSISRHLAFIDLEAPATAQLYDVVLPCGVRLDPDALVLPDYCTLAPADLHLTMGGALTERLGGEDSAQVMSQIRAGQIVLVTATFDAAENAMVCLDCVILAEPVLEGWEAGVWVGTGDADQYLQLDIADESIVLVDDATKLSAMSTHLHTATASATVIGLDCEWQPARIKGDRSPASLLQLAVDNTVYVIDLLRCCRTELLAGAELSTTEQLLNDALSTLLSSAEVIKTGLQPRNDLLQLSRTYKHMPCFSGFDGVVDLFQLGTHAVSLGAVMRNDRSSLSKLSEIVLGKRLNKAEQHAFELMLLVHADFISVSYLLHVHTHGCPQCSQWGYRPLSPQQLQYAAIDARASLLLYNKLQPEVPAKHFNSIKRTYKYISGPGKGEMLTAKSAISAKAVARKAAIPRAEITVSKYEVDVDGLRQRWLGKPLPDVRKEGVVRACLDPQYAVFAQDDSTVSISSSSSGEIDGSETSSRSSYDPALGSKSKAVTAAFFKYDRHQSFIEFKTAVALLMNFGKGDNIVLHDGDSDSYTSSNGYHTTANGDRSSSTDATAATQHQQQQQQHGEKRVVWSMQGRTASKDDDDVIRFLEKVSSTTDTLLPLGQLHTSTAASAASAAAETASSTSLFPGHKLDSSSADHDPLRLVLFCRAPGHNFVYCGEVTCYHHEYVWRDGEEVGSIRLSLALQDWPQLAEKLQQQSSSDSGVLPYFQNPAVELQSGTSSITQNLGYSSSAKIDVLMTSYDILRCMRNAPELSYQYRAPTAQAPTACAKDAHTCHTVPQNHDAAAFELDICMGATACTVDGLLCCAALYVVVVACTSSVEQVHE
eukprot:8415-Heterococcus_DN1.PRE.2